MNGFFVFLSLSCLGVAAHADSGLLSRARNHYQNGSYWEAAQTAFEARGKSPESEAQAYAWVTMALVKNRMPQAATYFFIRTLQSKNVAAIRQVLTVSEQLLNQAGVDLLRPYMVRHTRLEDYNADNRNAFLYALGKDLLLKADYRRALEFLKGVRRESPLWPHALLARATAKAILGDTSGAIADFQSCESSVSNLTRYADDLEASDREMSRREAEDLRNRCIAGVARTYYQDGEFEKADFHYDRIQKSSFVWPEILFEQAWNAFSQREYNRALGKLVSYRSPALQFVFNSEVDVLNAQSYLALCLYADANAVINEFHQRYAGLGEEVKRFVEGNAKDPLVFFNAGKKALADRLHTANAFHRMMNRFVRSPHFQSLVQAEKRVARERARAQSLGRGGLAGFLGEVLQWRQKNIQTVGGIFVKNSLIDYHTVLISDFEKMAFIKLEMLNRAKGELLRTSAESGRADRRRGNIVPKAKGYQYYWSFNGEYWNDELGDYVFGLQSQCQS